MCIEVISGKILDNYLIVQLEFLEGDLKNKIMKKSREKYES